MKYMLLLYGPDKPLPEPGTPEFTEMVQNWDTATGAMAKCLLEN
jgi:hypothetical protein